MIDCEILLALANRCEMVKGRDPWLNRDIEIALGNARRCDNLSRHTDAYVMPLHRHDYLVPPSYSSSVDAAMRLRPTDWHIELRGVNDSWHVTMNETANLTTGKAFGFAATPALALSAAALRAIAL